MQVVSSKDALEGMEVRIVVDLGLAGGDRTTLPGLPSTTVKIVVVSVIIVLSICIITTLQYWYAKKNGKWCFISKQYQHRQTREPGSVEPARTSIEHHQTIPYSRPS